MSKNLCYRVELNVIGASITEPYVPAIIPRDSITGLEAALMQFDRGEANANAVNFTIIADETIRAFLTSQPDHEKIAVSVWEYDGWQPSNERCLFRGRMDAPPVVAIGADATAYHCRAVGWLATYTEIKLTDPKGPPDTPYRDVHVKWLINRVLAAAEHRGGARVETAGIDALEPYCARVFYPGRHKFGGAYNVTDKIQALCWNGTVLYLGVGRWLCSYNPATEEKIRVAELRYTGKLNITPEQWRIKSLAYDAGTVYGWAESTYENLFEDAAHPKIKFTWAAGPTIQLTDANRVWNYDRGYYIKSSPREAKNYGGPAGTDFAEWFYGDIGEAQPPSDKTLGLPLPTDVDQSTLLEALAYNTDMLMVNWVVGKKINYGDRVMIRSGTQFQDMGTVYGMAINPGVYWRIWVTNKARHNFPIGTTVYWWNPTELRPNVCMPGYREVKINYDQADDEGSATPVNVQVERRLNAAGKSNFYFPEILGTVSEDTALPVFTPHISLGECNPPQEYRKDGADTYYRTEGVPPFNLHMEDVARFANLPVAGYWVENKKQESDRDQVGRNRLMFNGNPVRIVNEAGNPKIETYCNIFLAQDGNKFYCAFNRWRDSRWGQFYQIVWGYLNGAEFTMIGIDRTKELYTFYPPRELTGFTHYQNKYWFGVKRIEPRWIETDIELIWAAPPQAGDKPTDYDGGLAVVCMVSYDKTEYLEAGKLIRIRFDSDTYPKNYLISEVESIPPRNITTTNHSHRIYGWEGRTYFVALELHPFYPPTTYSQQAKGEMLGPDPTYSTYLNLMDTYDIRGEICYAEPNKLVVAHTATAPVQDDFEGDYYDFHQQEWHGEEVQPEMYGRMAEADLSEDNVIDPTVAPITVTLKNGKKEFTLANGGLVDVTDNIRGEMQIPPLGHVYLDRHGTWNKKEATLYFNPVYAGFSFDVEYSYYTERLFVAPFVFKNELYFNETADEQQFVSSILPFSLGSNRSAALYKYTWNPDPPPGAWEWRRVDAWPDTPAAIAVAGDDVYALSENSILMRYGKRWPAYIEGPVGGYEDVDGFGVLANAALAADCYIAEEGGAVVISPRLKRAGAKIPAIRMFIYSEIARPPAYDAVKVIYAGGVAYVGPYDIPDSNVCTINAPYVSAYGHAQVLAQRYYNYYKTGVIYDMRLKHDGVLGLKIGQMLQVDTVSGRLLLWKLDGDEVAIKLEASARLFESENIPITKEVA